MQNQAAGSKNVITILRAILTLAIVFLGVYNMERVFGAEKYLLFYMLAVVASNLLFALLPGEYYEGTKLHFFIFITDIIIISLGGYWLAGMNFTVFMLIFLAIFISAIGQSVGLSLVTAVVINALYFFMTYFYGANAQEALFDERGLMIIPFIFIVALHSSYLAQEAGRETADKKRLESVNKMLSFKVKDTAEERASFAEFTARVYDSFREGIIITDSQCQVLVFNVRCENLFGRRRSAALNMNAGELEWLGEAGELLKKIRHTKYMAVEKPVELEIDGASKSTVINTTQIKDREGNVLGYMCVIRVPFSPAGGSI